MLETGKSLSVPPAVLDPRHVQQQQTYSFAQTQKDDDERFFATFPAARSQQLVLAQITEYTPFPGAYGFYCDGVSSYTNKLAYSVPYSPVSPLEPIPPSQQHYESDGTSYNIPSPCSDMSCQSPYSYTSFYDGQEEHETQTASAHKVLPSHQTLVAPQLGMAIHAVPATRTKDEPLMDFLPPPDLPQQSTGETIAQSPFALPSSASPVDASPASQIHLVHADSEPRLSPISSAHMHSGVFDYNLSSWHLCRSPSPKPTRRPATLSRQDRKQTEKKTLGLACFFCRGRKIACGAPEPDNPDRTCNQCLRRSLKCEYPLESRRGMRRKKPASEENRTVASEPLKT